MAWTHYQYILALTLVITGSLNTLTTKWSDRLTAVGKDGEERPFVHPFVQSFIMFMGELLCLLWCKVLHVYYRRKEADVPKYKMKRRYRDFNPFILCFPSMCDMIATSIMNTGLILTYASSYQMLRGAVIVFTGVFSIIFLTRKLSVQEWVGIGFILAGLTVVGLSDCLSTGSDAAHSRTDLIAGDLLIVVAQVIVATQMVYEEYYVSGLGIPALQAIGWEGFFGMTILGILLIPMYFIRIGVPFGVPPDGSLEDTIDAVVQMKNNWLITFSQFGTFILIAFYNFSGISVTIEMSATTRMVLDSIRTLLIWMSCLVLKWQEFMVLQLFGFFILIIGMCLYNDIIIFRVYGILRRTFLRYWYGETQNPETQNSGTQEAKTQRANTQTTYTQEAETQEAETQEAETQEAETQEAETQEAETQEAETQEAETQEAEMQEAEAQEAETQEA